MPLWTIVWLYRSGQFYWRSKPEDLEKTTDMAQVTDKLYHITLHWVYRPWTKFELTTLVVIGTECTCSCKSNYQTIMTTYRCQDRGVGIRSNWFKNPLNYFDSTGWWPWCLLISSARLLFGMSSVENSDRSVLCIIIFISLQIILIQISENKNRPLIYNLNTDNKSLCY